MWTIIANLLTSGAVGSITGLVGIAVQRYFDLKNASVQIQKSAQDNAHELAMRQADLAMTQAEATSNFKIAELDASTRDLISQDDLRKAAYSLEPQVYNDRSRTTEAQMWLYTLLDFVRGLIRPGLTAYFAVALTVIFLKSFNAMTKDGTILSPEQGYAIVIKCVDLVVTLFSTCATFFFGTRNLQSEAKARSGK